MLSFDLFNFSLIEMIPYKLFDIIVSSKGFIDAFSHNILFR